MQRRVLLDECPPKKLKRELRTMRRSGAGDGLVGEEERRVDEARRGQFEVFLTSDQNLRYQHNLTYARLGGTNEPYRSAATINATRQLSPTDDQGRRVH